MTEACVPHRLHIGLPSTQAILTCHKNHINIMLCYWFTYMEYVTLYPMFIWSDIKIEIGNAELLVELCGRLTPLMVYKCGQHKRRLNDAALVMHSFTVAAESS